jgi:hypothetical protein
MHHSKCIGRILSSLIVDVAALGVINAIAFGRQKMMEFTYETSI